MLKDDLETRLKSCSLEIHEEQDGIITDMAERYVKAIIWYITERFQPDVLEVFDAFSTFDLGKFPPDSSSNEFTVHCNSEVEILCQNYFVTDDKKRNE